MERTKSWKSIQAKLVRHDLKGHCSELWFNTDAYWKCMVRHFGIQGGHLSSTCRMGSISDPTAVVDPYLRYCIHRLQNYLITNIHMITMNYICLYLYLKLVCLMVFNTIFNNISIIWYSGQFYW